MRLWWGHEVCSRSGNRFDPFLPNLIEFMFVNSQRSFYSSFLFGIFLQFFHSNLPLSVVLDVAAFL